MFMHKVFIKENTIDSPMWKFTKLSQKLLALDLDEC